MNRSLEWWDATHNLLRGSKIALPYFQAWKFLQARGELNAIGEITEEK